MSTVRAAARLGLVLLAAATLAACAQAPQLPAAPKGATALDAQASPAARDKVCQTYLAEYQRLDWNYSADRKKELLDRIGATGSGVAISPLTEEYGRLDWNYSAERKQLLMGVVSRLLTGSNTPCTTSTVTPAQRDQVCQTYLGEYQRLDWNYSAERKKLLLDPIAATGSDLGITAFTDEYQRLDWNYSADRKRLLMGAIARALAVPTVPCHDTRQGLKKPSAAKQALAKALKADLAEAPAADRKLAEELLAKLG